MSDSTGNSIPKKTRSCSLLLDLPVSVLTIITSQYLLFPYELCQLDIAISNASDRRHFHASIVLPYEESLWEDYRFKPWLAARDHIRCTEVRLIDPSPSPDYTLSAWLSKNAPFIRRLCIQNASYYGESLVLAIRDLCKACSQLTSFTLLNCYFPLDWDIILPSTLREIALRLEKYVTYRLIKQLVNGCPDLELLSITSRSAPNLCPADLCDLPFLPQLRHFKINRRGKYPYSKVDADALLFWLAKGSTKLQTLEVANLMGFTIKGLIAIGSSCPIEKLAMNSPPSFSTVIPEKHLHNWGDLDEALTFFPRLRKLRVCKCPELTGASWLENMPFLTDLTLSNCANFQSMGRILSFSSLTALSLDTLHLLDSHLFSLSRPLPNLQILCISRCYGISNSGIVSLLRYCPNLVCLKLKRNMEVDDEIISRALHICPKLETFSGHSITHISCAARCEGSTHLKTLKLFGCGFYSPKDLINLLLTCSERHGLECLWIEDCKLEQSFYPKIMSAMASHSSTLRSLTLLGDYLPHQDTLNLLRSLKRLSSFTGHVLQDEHPPVAHTVAIKDYRKASPFARLHIKFHPFVDDTENL